MAQKTYTDPATGTTYIVSPFLDELWEGAKDVAGELWDTASDAAPVAGALAGSIFGPAGAAAGTAAGNFVNDAMDMFGGGGGSGGQTRQQQGLQPGSGGYAPPPGGYTPMQGGAGQYPAPPSDGYDPALQGPPSGGDYQGPGDVPMPGTMAVPAEILRWLGAVVVPVLQKYGTPASRWLLQKLGLGGHISHTEMNRCAARMLIKKLPADMEEALLQYRAGFKGPIDLSERGEQTFMVLLLNNSGISADDFCTGRCDI